MMQPIAHRDLKPANLMFSGNLHADVEQLILDSGVVKVCDFGELLTKAAGLEAKSLSVQVLQCGFWTRR